MGKYLNGARLVIWKSKISKVILAKLKAVVLSVAIKNDTLIASATHTNTHELENTDWSNVLTKNTEYILNHHETPAKRKENPKVAIFQL